MRPPSRQTWRRMSSGLRSVIVVGWLVNTGLGVLFAVSYMGTPWSLPFVFVPLLMLYRAGRGCATARTDRVRLAALQRATHVLAVPIDPRDAFPAFLREVVAGFEAGAVEFLTPAGGLVAHRSATSDEVVVEPLPTSGPVAECLDASGCIAAPMRAGDRVVGELRVHDRSGAAGFDDGERAVLEALAAEAAGALEKAALLDSVLEERHSLSTSVEATSDGILAVDADGVVRTWNPGLEAMTGYAAASMVGNPHAGVLRARDAAGAHVLLERWAEEGVELPADLQVVAVDGTTRGLSCSYTRVPSKDDRPAVLVVMAREVTRVHEVERLKEDFVATVSHELRTPLTPIKGFANMLLESGDRLGTDGRKAAAESILRSAQRLERLIVNLLEVSRVESHVLEVRNAVVPVVPVVSRVVEEFRTAFPDRVIELDVVGTPEARGSEQRVEQILSNLLSNAVKYTPAPSPIAVGLRVDGRAVELVVVDRGPGVPEHEAERIFQRFERLGQDRRQAGTGLGLYIARELAHAMNGTLAVSAGADGGAVFALRLPAAAELEAGVPAPGCGSPPR
jgi:PAS domain S-box-containing protein